MTRSQSQSRRDPPPSGLAEARPQRGIAEQPVDRRPQRLRVPRWHEQAGLLRNHQIEEAADGRRDDRLPVRHRLGAGEAEALSPRGTDDDRGPRVEAVALGRGDRPGARHPLAQRPVAHDHEVQPLPCLEQLLDALLRRQPPDEENLRRVGLPAWLVRQHDAVRDHVDPLRAEALRLHRERSRDADHRRRAPEDRAGEGRRAVRERDVGSVERDDERPSRGGGRRSRRKPVGVNEIGGGRRPARARGHRAEQRRAGPRPAAEVGDDAVAVGEPEIAEVARGEHVDLDPATPEALDGIGDEAAGEVVVVPRIGGREDRDPHGRERENTTGAATISIASTKK